MTSLDVNILYEYLLKEILNSDLTKIDESLYENVATYFKQNRNNGNNTKSINNILSSEEKSLIMSLIKRLLEARFKKIFLNPTEKLSLPNLIPEERFLFEIYKQFRISTDQLLKNIEMGNISVLYEMKRKITKKAVLVKIHSDIPPFIGVDLQKYGPLEPEDVTILPYSNIEPFLNKLSLSEGWVELS
jgi:DNA replication initiation complex subunit (GINS family)